MEQRADRLPTAKEVLGAIRALALTADAQKTNPRTAEIVWKFILTALD